EVTIAITPATATNAVNTNHTLTITVTAVGTTVGNGSATASIKSGTAHFLTSLTWQYKVPAAAASCTGDNTAPTTGTTVVSAASSIPLTVLFSVTLRTHPTSRLFPSTTLFRSEVTIAITPATATNAVNTNHTLTITVTAVGTTVGNGSATASI